MQEFLLRAFRRFADLRDEVAAERGFNAILLNCACGAGPDLVLAAQDVGPDGRVVGVRVRERVPYGVEDLASEPTFPRDPVGLMRRLLRPRLHARVGVRIVLEARPAPRGAPPAQRLSSWRQ